MRRVMRGALALVLLALALRSSAAGAVDRSLGADLPKPAATGDPWTADAVDGLKHDLDALLDGAPTLHGAHVGLLAIDTRSGHVLYARNPDDAFVPASTFKLLTGSVALALLGPEHRFRTEALMSSGALFVRPGGDPLLHARDLDALATALKAAGLPKLRALYIDSSAFEPAPYLPGWTWDDFPFSYSARVSAATVEENVIHLTVAPGAAAGAPAIVSAAPAPFDGIAAAPPKRCAPSSWSVNAPSLTPYSRAVTGAAGSPDTVDVAPAPNIVVGCIVLAGSIPLGSKPEIIDAAVPSPVWYLHEIVANALQRARIDSTGIGPLRTAGGEPIGEEPNLTPPDARLVWTHDGEPLADLLADMWWPSDNLVAELLLREIGRQTAGTPGTSAHGVAAEKAWLTSIGVDPATLTIVDGSGLSSYDRVTPRALVAILQADWNGPYRELVLDDLPLSGVRGTTSGDFKGTLAAGRTFAKTGSMNHTRGLAGYLATLRHGAVTFAWSVDDWLGTQDDLDALRARVLTRMIGD